MELEAAEELAETRRRYPILSKLFNHSKGPAGQTVATCIGCGKQQSNPKTGRLIQHILEKCRQTSMDLIEELRDSVREYETKQEQRKTSEKDVAKTARHQFFDSILVDLVACNSLSINFIKSREMTKMFANIDPAYKIPSRTRFADVLLKNRASFLFEQGLENMAQEEDFSLTLEFDGWTSKAGLAYLGILISTRKGHSLLIDLLDISGIPHTASNLADLILESLRRTSIPSHKFISIVSDQASNCRAARREIIKQNEFKHMIEFRCMAHVVNLIAAHFIKSTSIQKPMADLLDLINFISRNKILCCKLKMNGANRPVHYVPTRWYTAGQAVNSILSLKPHLELIMQDENSPELGVIKWGPIVRQDDFWKVLNETRGLFDKISATIGRIERADTTLSEAFGALLDLAKFIWQDIPQRASFKSDAMNAFLLHFCRLDHDLLLAAYALDPQQRLRYLTDEALEEASLGACALLLRSDFSRTVASGMLQEFERYKNMVKKEPIIITTDIKTWWENSGYFALRLPAMRLANCHGSSANTERMFSALNRIVSCDRNRLSQDTIFDLISVQIALRSREQSKKRQTPSEQDEASWEDQIEEALSKEAYLLDEEIIALDREIQEQEDSTTEDLVRSFTNFIDFDLHYDEVEMDLSSEGAGATQTREEADRAARFLLEEFKRNQS